MGVGTEAKWAVGPKERKAHEQEKATRGRERAVSSSHRPKACDQETQLSSWLPKREAGLEGPSEERSLERSSPSGGMSHVRLPEEQGPFLRGVKT